MAGSSAQSVTVLDERSAAMMQLGGAMAVASCDAQHRTSLVWGHGSRISEDRRSVTVFVAASQSAELLQHVAQTQRIAVVYTEMPSNRSLQIKGQDAAVSPLEPGDHARVMANCAAFVAKALQEGYPEPPMRAYVRVEPDDIVAVSFTPSAAFVSTPGPHAGQPLRGETL